MSEFKGTPGPWWSEDESFSSCGEDAVITCDDRYGMVEICRIDQGGTIADEDEPFVVEQQANANLIAAAPELLEALQEMVSAIKITLRVGHERIVELGGGCDSPEVMIKGHSEIARAEAAITKALGQ